MTNWQLIIFDMDGTLAERDTGELLTGVAEYFADFEPDTALKFALTTNQGGVGLRYWMETEKFGEPEKFPAESQIRDTIATVMNNIHSATGLHVPFNIQVCFAYRSKQGNISPAPPEFKNIREWNISNRKPNPGMLTDAMEFYAIDADHTLMVGDRPEDKRAAENAQCSFVWAWDFFRRDEPDEVQERMREIKKRALEFAGQLVILAKQNHQFASTRDAFIKAYKDVVDDVEAELLHGAIQKHAKKWKYLPEYEVEAELYLNHYIMAVSELGTDN